MSYMNRVCYALLVVVALLLVPFSTAVMAGNDPWVPTGDIHTRRSRAGLAFDAVTGHFFLAGGETGGGLRDLPIEEFDPATGKWTERAHLQVGVANTGAVFVNGFLYIPGGYTGAEGVNLMQRYNPANNLTVLLSPMPAANFGHAVTTHAGKIHVLGGSASGDVGTTHYVYDIATDQWGTLEPLPVAVNYPAAVSLGDYVFVMGGNTSDLSTVQVYVPELAGWRFGPNLHNGRGGAGAFVDSSMRIHVVGGGWGSYLASTEVLDDYFWADSAPLVQGARTMPVAYGNGVAVKAGGWAGGFLGTAEIRIDNDRIFADSFGGSPP